MVFWAQQDKPEYCPARWIPPAYFPRVTGAEQEHVVGVGRGSIKDNYLLTETKVKQNEDFAVEIKLAFHQMLTG